MNENESKKVPEVILAPLTGKAVPLSEVPDPVFSDKGIRRRSGNYSGRCPLIKCYL